MARSFSRKFYRSKQWETTRQLALMRDNYLCVLCGKPAQEVHHITHLNEQNIYDPSITLDLDNLISLCRDCHFQQHKSDRLNAIKRDDCGDGYQFDSNGMLIPSEH